MEELHSGVYGFFLRLDHRIVEHRDFGFDLYHSPSDHDFQTSFSLRLLTDFHRVAPLGVGMAAAIFILILFAGHRVLGTPVAWPVAAQILVAVMGAVALARQFGVLR